MWETRKLQIIEDVLIKSGAPVGLKSTGFFFWFISSKLIINELKYVDWL